MAPAPLPPRHANLRRQWLALALVLLGLTAWLSLSQSLRPIDHLIQDTGLRLQARPASPDIVIIAIDDASIQAIGRWPWRRALHAQLVRQISAQEPLALGLDILFGEPDPDYPGDDLLLAQALQHSARAVLPVAQRSQGSDAVDAPLPLLRQAAAQLGHVQVQVDTDGLVRGLFQREGPQHAPWPHFSIAMQCAAGAADVRCRGAAAPAHGAWVRMQPHLINFASGYPAFTTYSYIDVLKGRIPAGALHGKYVLVGATATGLGDMFTTPVAAPLQRIPGVELIAHALGAALTQAQMRAVPQLWNLACNLLPTGLALLGIAWLGPLAGLLACVALFLGTLAAALLLPFAGWQIASAPALACVALVYPLWSWRRLSAAAHFLQLEMQELQRAGLSPLPDGAPRRALLSDDRLAQRIHAVEDASRRLRRLHTFISSSLQHLPSPTFVCDNLGLVRLANTAAQHYVQPADGRALQGCAIAWLLADLVAPTTGHALFKPSAPMAALPQRQEAQDGRGRHLLVLSEPFHANDSTIWLITLVDLTEIRRAQEQRNLALNFISHDIRAPIASILTLLEMRQAFPDQITDANLYQRIQRHARQSLDMAQGFVELASARDEPFQGHHFDLAATLQECLDDAWASAHQRGVQLRLAPLPESAPIDGENHMVRRAITNLLSNAIKFSPTGGTVVCALVPQEFFWCISVTDQGPGIDPNLRAKLFQPFQRHHQSSHPEIDGIGLGLALVHAVAQRHGGRIEVSDTAEAGTEFHLLLPQATPQP